MTTHRTGTREDWLAARVELLQAEKELTRQGDELTRRRQALPGVRSQLLVYHFMFGPDYTAGCPSCSAIADGFNGIAVHLANHDVMLWAVSRVPLGKLPSQLDPSPPRGRAVAAGAARYASTSSR